MNAFSTRHHAEFIHSPVEPVVERDDPQDSESVLAQLVMDLSLQTEEVKASNKLRGAEIRRQTKNNERSKDKVKDIHKNKITLLTTTKMPPPTT